MIGIFTPKQKTTNSLKYIASSIPANNDIVSAANVLLTVRFTFPLCHVMGGADLSFLSDKKIWPPQLSTPFRLPKLASVYTTSFNSFKLDNFGNTFSTFSPFILLSTLIAAARCDV